MNKWDTIQAMEEQLRTAMLAGDVPTLDALLADTIQVIGPDGRLVGKADDLAAHQSGVVRFISLTPIDISTQLLPDVAIVFVHMAVSGIFQGQPFAGHYRYTRVWRLQDACWQIIAAHISPVPDSQSSH